MASGSTRPSFQLRIGSGYGGRHGRIAAAQAKVLEHGGKARAGGLIRDPHSIGQVSGKYARSLLGTAFTIPHAITQHRILSIRFTPAIAQAMD